MDTFYYRNTYESAVGYGIGHKKLKQCDFTCVAAAVPWACRRAFKSQGLLWQTIFSVADKVYSPKMGTLRNTCESGAKYWSQKSLCGFTHVAAATLILKFGLWSYSPSMWGKRFVQIIQWFSMGQMILELELKPETLDAEAWNLSSGTTALVGRGPHRGRQHRIGKNGL